MKAWTLPLLFAMAGTAACSSDPMVNTDAGMESSVQPDPDSFQVQACGETLSLENPGTQEGTDFAPFEIAGCASSPETISFYGDPAFCSSQVTLLVIAALWCGPCNAEAPLIEELITTNPRYMGKVRVLTVVAQGTQGGVPATRRDCENWQSNDRFTLTSTIGFDATNKLGRYFPNQALPSNLVVNRQGRIIRRIYGTSAGLDDVRCALDCSLNLEDRDQSCICDQ